MLFLFFKYPPPKTLHDPPSSLSHMCQVILALCEIEQSFGPKFRLKKNGDFEECEQRKAN